MTSSRTSPDAPANAPLRHMAQRVLGSSCRFEDRSRRFGRRTILWGLTASDGSAFFLKCHEHRHHHAAEVLSLRKWVPLLGEADWWTAPEVEESDEELGAVIVTAVPGDLFSKAVVTEADEEEAFRLAGRLASRLHGLSVDPFECGHPTLYDAAQLQKWMDLAAPHLSDDMLEWVQETCCAPGAFEGLVVVPTHSDFAPRNWLIDRSAKNLRLGVIDWERARAGYWIEDMQRLAQADWQRRPELRSSFFEGYGRDPSPREDHQLRLIGILTAAITLPWALEHGDDEFADFGRATLERLRSEG